MAFIFNGNVNRFINPSASLWSYNSLFPKEDILSSYKAFSVKFESGMYIPVKPILISVIAVFILVFIIMKYSIGKINKQNTIETIRNENI